MDSTMQDSTNLQTSTSQQAGVSQPSTSRQNNSSQQNSATQQSTATQQGTAAQQSKGSAIMDTIGSGQGAARSTTGGTSPSGYNQGGNSQGNRIGNMSVTEFNNLNTNGSQMVKAITPTRGTMSQSDQQLLIQVASGVQRQLAISQAVLEKLTNPQVKMLAASEVEEQTGVAAKLKEIATAMGLTLPANADSSGQNIKSQIQNLSGNQLDSYYLNEGGIRGHELLQQTMTMVNSTAKDPSLKQLATATLPVIRTHLTVSRDIRSSMGNTGTGGASTSQNR